MSVLERKRREFRRREQEVLAAALALFERDDWQAVTVEEIAAKTGIGKGTIYRHFGSKEDIHARITIDSLRGLAARLRAVDRDGPVLEVLREMALALLRGCAGSREPVRRLVRRCLLGEFQGRVSPRVAAELVSAEADIWALLADAIERGVRQGIFAPGPTEQLLMPLASVMLGAVALMPEREGREAEEERWSFLIETVLSGLTAAGSRAAT